MSPSIKLGISAGLAIAAACLALVLLAPPNAQAATATLVATVPGADALDAVPDPPANRAAGGLHRGLRTSVMAWADVQRPGRVYRVDPQPAIRLLPRR